jgi:hypothetical protein
MSTLRVNTIQTSVPSGTLEFRDSDDALTTIRPSALRGTASATAPVFQDSAGTPIGTLCRAWVNFNGTGTVAIRTAFNVSSITDNGTGNYTLNFTTPMPDADYAVCFGFSGGNNAIMLIDSTSVSAGPGLMTTSQLRFTLKTPAGSALDGSNITVSIFR